MARKVARSTSTGKSSGSGTGGQTGRSVGNSALRGRKRKPSSAGFHGRVDLAIRCDGLVSDRGRIKLDLRKPSSSVRAVVQAGKLRKTAELLGALAHLQRLQLLAELLRGPATHRQLVKTTGLQAGPLYYHIRELRQQRLLAPKQRDIYDLTRRGRRALLAALAVEQAIRT